jgi:hypothetical protein
MQLDLQRVRHNARSATTEDLLDRMTVYRAGMEPQALQVIREELEARGISATQIVDHEERRRGETTFLPDGTAVRCTFCHRPAVGEGWGWHRLWDLVPVFPRFFHYCAEHLPGSPAEVHSDAEDCPGSG